MPPTRTPRRPAARQTSPPADRGQGLGEGPADDMGPRAPKVAPPRNPGVRTSAKEAELILLKQELQQTYTGIGMVLRPLGGMIPHAKSIGENMVAYSDQAADAWIALAEKDAKVFAALKQISQASVWGQLIAVHFAIFAAAALPGIPRQQQSEPRFTADSTGSIADMAAQMGVSEEEFKIMQDAAFAMANQTSAVDRTTGGPGDTIRAQPNPEASSAASRTGKPGIVSPQELGVVNGNPYNVGEFPADYTAPNGR